MKRIFVLSLFLFSVTLFAQTTVNFETNGNNWNWVVFDASKANFDVVANPSVGGGNITDSCAKFQITDVTADPWIGVFSTDFPDFTFNATNCYVRIWVYKDHISDVGLKIEPARPTDYNIPNTVINQWEQIVFDYSAYIGMAANTLVVIPDFSANPRTYTSTSYFDQISFTNVVPVELTSFTASVVGNSVQLQWATATETNNQGFEIQRSSDNVNFATVAFIRGSGTTTETKYYSYVDNTDMSGSFYYRLKQLDFGGNYHFSNIVEVTRVVSFELSQNYPNPFNPSTTISFSLPQSSLVTLKVYDILGSEVAELVNGQVEAGIHKVNFNAYNLNSGIYFYTIKAGNFTETKKLMLVK